MPVVCERCGSIQLIKARGDSRDVALSVLTGARIFVCRRCGWSARRKWSDADLDYSSYYSATAETELDPALKVLDEPSRGAAQVARRRRKHRKRKRTHEFDLAGVRETPFPEAGSVTDLYQPHSSDLPLLRSRRRNRDHRLRPGRREVLATIAITSLALFLTVIIVMGQSCASTADF